MCVILRQRTGRATCPAWLMLSEMRRLRQRRSSPCVHDAVQAWHAHQPAAVLHRDLLEVGVAWPWAWTGPALGPPTRGDVLFIRDSTLLARPSRPHTFQHSFALPTTHHRVLQSLTRMRVRTLLWLVMVLVPTCNLHAAVAICAHHALTDDGATWMDDEPRLTVDEPGERLRDGFTSHVEVVGRNGACRNALHL